MPGHAGLWNGGIAIPQQVGAQRGLRGESLTRWRRKRSRNGAVRFYPEPRHNAAIANFTCLVGVALSDQSVDGCGNLGKRIKVVIK